MKTTCSVTFPSAVTSGSFIVISVSQSLIAYCTSTAITVKDLFNLNFAGGAGTCINGTSIGYTNVFWSTTGINGTGTETLTMTNGNDYYGHQAGMWAISAWEISATTLTEAYYNSGGNWNSCYKPLYGQGPCGTPTNPAIASLPGTFSTSGSVLGLYVTTGLFTAVSGAPNPSCTTPNGLTKAVQVKNTVSGSNAISCIAYSATPSSTTPGIKLKDTMENCSFWEETADVFVAT